MIGQSSVTFFFFEIEIDFKISLNLTIGKMTLLLLLRPSKRDSLFMREGLLVKA